MKLGFLKRKKGRGGRGSAAGRRMTGVQRELPVGVSFALKAAVGILIAIALLVGVGKIFQNYYFHGDDLFVLRDLHNSVSITTGKTLKADLVCEILGLKKGVNLFSIPIEAKRREMLERAPNIRSMEIVRQLPDKISVSIVERDPVARVGRSGQVVDEEGVVFVCYAGTGTMPFIKGSDATLEFVPGDRLHGLDKAAIQVVMEGLRPQSRMRLAMVDASKSDYLLLTLIDNRQAKLAWEGMGRGGPNATERLRRQMDELEKVLESEIGKASRVFNATIPGRVVVSMSGVH